MTPLATIICAAIVLSTGLGVYLRLRQMAFVSRNRDAAPRDFAGEVTLEEHRRAADYTLARTRFSIFETVYDGILSLLWLLFGLAPLYNLIARATVPGLNRSVALFVAFVALAELLAMPLSLANTFWLEARFGFNRQSLASFLADWLKAGALQLAVGAPLLYAMFALLRAAPDYWWLCAFVGFMAFIVAMMAVYPTFIAPLFNKFSPLPEDDLRRRLEALLQKCGFESRGLYVMDASTRSARGNAYFTGFGKAKRIVLFDTLLAKHTPEEIESILAHELGHFKFGHIRQMLAMAAGLAFVGFAALHWALGPQGLSVVFALPADPGLALIIAVLAKDPLLHILSPLMAWRSRRAEFEADDFAKRMVGKEPMIAALTRLTRDNLATLTPDRLYALFYYSHPPVPVRVAHLRGEA
ncbi:MAG: M48 family metallopeptidase [Methylocystis sp.]